VGYRRQGIRLLLAVTLFATLLGAGVGRPINGSADFHLVLSCVVLAIFLLLHRMQRRNNQAIEKKLDELIARKRPPKKCPENR
jgi:low affinity Fe/Cu permease